MVRAVPLSTAGELAASYAEVFAENVEMDFPLARRFEYLQHALTSLGRIRPNDDDTAPKFERPSTALWSLNAEFGRLELYIELIPVAPFEVQTFSAHLVNGWSKVKLF